MESLVSTGETIEAESHAKTCRQDVEGSVGSQFLGKVPKHQRIPGYIEAGMSSGTVRAMASPGRPIPAPHSIAEGGHERTRPCV